ncbi:MAG: hypothetical protein HS126_09135 [Anaerolineales bacterium]|nr:hypothetical protein [Anaerolineales bacterium]
MPALTWLRQNWLTLVVISGLVLAFIFLRNSPTAGINSLQALDGLVSSGQPTVLEFYSNF